MLMQFFHVLAAVLVLAEALNKLERSSLFAPGLTLRRRLVGAVKALGWMLLALGAGGAVASPVLLALGVRSGDLMLMRLERPTLAETAVMLGYALLIVRTRLGERTANAND